MTQGQHATAGNSPTAIGARLTRAGFSHRQTTVLEGLFGLCRDELDRRLGEMLSELEQSLFRSAEQARSDEVQRALLETQRLVRERREAFKPAFLSRLETALATLSEAPAAKLEEPRVQFSELALVDTSAMDEAVALKEIATRGEIRNSLSLFLLGQRLGVVARAPAFDTETLPMGPRHLCQMLRESATSLDLDVEARGLVYRQFDRSVMQHLGPFFETLNNYLIAENVLPHLTYVPPRSAQRGRTRTAEAGSSSDQAKEAAHAHDPRSRARTTPLPPGAPDMQRIPDRAGGAFQPPLSGHSAASGNAGIRPGADALHTTPGARVAPPAMTPGSAPTAPARPGLFPAPGQAASLARAPAAGSGAGSPAVGPQTIPWSHAASEPVDDDGRHDVELFDTLRKLLKGRRGLLDRLNPQGGNAIAATPEQVQSSLAQLQQHFNERADDAGVFPFAQIKRSLLAQLQQQAPDDKPVQLSSEQGDTVDLVGMLFEQIAQEVRPQSPGGSLLAQLQLPLLRVAIQDQGFFTERSHPARRMLEVIAETSAYWSSEDELDRDLIQRMGSLVRRVNQETSTDPAVFRDLMDDLAGYLTTQQRKAEISERRHVEAARGREKLEIARLQAEEAIEQLLADKTVPKFLQTLLQQVWTDVLALALLRGSEQAPAFVQHLALVQRLVDAATHKDGAKPVNEAEAAQMREEINAALGQVGYTGDDATSICDQFLSVAIAPVPADADTPGEAAAEVEPTSRTELTLRLRGRDRLGQDVQTDTPHLKTSARAKVGAKQVLPLSEDEKAWHDRLKRLPFGSWFEFTINQQGEKVRRRMSWYSNVTDHCLFVNHRGQRAGDYTLSWLARELNRGNVSLVETNRESIVDRAWKAIVTTLRSFGGNRDTAAPAAVLGTPS